MATSSIENITDDALAHASAQKRLCAMRFQETILGRLGKALHGQMGDITHEPLPKRWVDLIHRLNEEERRAEAFPKQSTPQEHAPKS